MNGLWFGGLLLGAMTIGGLPARAQEDETQQEYRLIVEDGQRKLQRGELSSARAAFDEVLQAAEEEQGPDRPAPELLATAQIALLEIDLRHGAYEQVRDAIAGAPPAFADRRECVLLHAEALRRLGAYNDAATLLRGLVTRDADDLEARHRLGDVLDRDGHRRRARAEWQANVEREPRDAVQRAFRGRSWWRLGGPDALEAASRDLVTALAAVPDLAVARITYGILKFEAYGEAAGFPSGEKDLQLVLEQHGDLEAALLAMYRIRSANAVLDPVKTEAFLRGVFAGTPRCVEAITLRAANVLDDRRYGDAANLLDSALAIDPNDRVTLCHRAAAAWLLHDAEGYAHYRARAAAGDDGWAEPDRILGDHLVALYRFADAVPFYVAALQADADDVATLHGLARAEIYTGDGQRARELLERAKAIAPGIVDPWRNNQIAVQELLDEQYTVAEHGPFRVQMHRDDAEVLTAYLLPVQLEAAEVLGAKYGWRPEQPTKVEVLHTWDDFSVRTIGFRGFTALGACFGKLITLVSPRDGDLRKQDFMWEATAWHEYTHVLTLGLSRHRVPRWLTEGFSVYEERVRDPAWERGMDRELFDAFHNRDIPPVRLLNRLFRGPRILFGYYQGGLIVELIARDHGFDKALELLRAYGDDLETEAAFERALGVSSQQFDQELLTFVERDKLRGMRLVPRFDHGAMQRLLVTAGRDPENLQARVDLAWACLQRDNPVDAGRWLAEVLGRKSDHAGALLVRAEMLRRRGERDAALDHWRRGFAGGADDFDSRIACGDALLEAGDAEGAAAQWQRAKACWPKCTEQESAPELRLARLYRQQGERTRAEMEMKAYCQRTARAFAPRWTLAEFERENGNLAQQAAYLVECNRIDPFHRELHVRLGTAYEALGKQAQAAREFEVAAAVLPSLDRQYLARDARPPADDAPEELEARGALWLRAARLRHALGDHERVAALLQRIADEAPGTAAAREAAALPPEWRRR